MIEKLSEYKITRRDGAFINVECNTKIINTLVQKINELVDAVNGFGKDMVFLRRKVLEITYKEPDQYKSITFMSDGHIKKFYGHDSIVELEVPLPQGTKITIRSIKGGDNDDR